MPLIQKLRKRRTPAFQSCGAIFSIARDWRLRVVRVDDPGIFGCTAANLNFEPKSTTFKTQAMTALHWVISDDISNEHRDAGNQAGAKPVTSLGTDVAIDIGAALAKQSAKQRNFRMANLIKRTNQMKDEVIKLKKLFIAQRHASLRA